MEQTIFQQIFEQLVKANKILIALPADLTPDNTASALGLFLFLQKMGKEVEIASAGTVPANLAFLPKLGSIKTSLQGGNSMVISVDISQKPVDEISYEPQGSRLNIFLKSKTQDYTEKDVIFSSDKTPYQVIVILDCASLENLGGLFERNAETIFSSPKINIDNKAGNEYFGAINLVDINASSISEILSDLLATYEQQLIDEDVATCLLTGIITKTNSFQHAQTTPKAFMKASFLVELGGRQQEVVKFLYKTKPLRLLRLWGRALARLKTTDSVLYSMLSREDFKKAEAGDADLISVLRELHDNTSGYKVVALLSEMETGGVKLLMATHPQVDLDKFSESLGHKLSTITMNLGTFKVVETILENVNLAVAEEKLIQLA
jgi:phosphoesterase RecJ-like protein